MALRKGIRRRLGGRKPSRGRADELTERTRREARAMSRRRRRQARRTVRPEQDLGIRLRGAALETRRRLRPLGAPVAAFLSWIARPVARSLLFVLQLIGALIAVVLEVGQILIRWLSGAVLSAALILTEATRRHVNPRSTVAFVGVAAAVGLGVSQFFDYHGVAVDAPAYAGEIGGIAAAPIVDRQTAGSAHLWILLPVAVLAAILMVAAYRGRTRLAGGVAICGLVGLAVALAVDLPQGLDVGRPGLAFTGTQAELLQGFWAEVACSAVLILCGGLLAHYSRGMSRERRRRQGTPGGAARRSPHREVGGIYPGLQAEQ
ncbi:MAG TPA: hypothetical protein VGE91_07230 [Solirubrobacterales bacterium]